MSPTVNRERLVAYLLDRARDEDETADHKERLASVRESLEVEGHRDRARWFRDIASAVERGDPDAFVALFP
jgi:hypothetical protein